MDDGGPSLAVRLMSIAGEYEIGVKRERQRLDARVAALSEANDSLERQSRNQTAEIERLAKVSAKQTRDADAAEGHFEDRLRAVELELMETRFSLHERTSLLLDVLKANKPLLEPGAPSENVDPAGKQALVVKAASGESVAALVLRSVGGRDVASCLDELVSQSKLTAPFSRSALVAAAEAGRDDVLSRILQPAKHLPLHSKTASPSNKPATVAESSPRASAASTAATLCEALLRACRSGHLAVARRLLAAGAPLTARSVHDGLYQTCLHAAAAGGHDTLVKLLLEMAKQEQQAAAAAAATPEAAAGLPPQPPPLHVDDLDAYRRTALHCAAAGNHAEAARLLLLNGGDPAPADAQGLRPVDLARGTKQLAAAAAAAPGKVAAAASGGAAQYPLYRSGVLSPNAAAPAVARVLADASVLFWNASVRANRHYSEKRFARAIDAYSAALELVLQANMAASPRDLATLHYNRARARYRLGAHCAAIEDCSTALQHDGTYRNALAQRAECYMSLFDFERAARDFASLLETDASDRQWARRLADARGMRDLSHYGVLGLRRDAEPGLIKRAYRALCLRWHPDKHADTAEDAVRANTAFRRITDAYEALSDAYKRMMYDMDPRSAAGTPAVNAAVLAAGAGAAGAAGAGAAGGAGEGFDRWYAREMEREGERDREAAAADAKDRAADAAEELKRAAARAVRERLVREAAAATSASVSSAAASAAAAAAPPVPSSARSAAASAASGAGAGGSPAASARTVSATAAAAATAPSMRPLPPPAGPASAASSVRAAASAASARSAASAAPSTAGPGAAATMESTALPPSGGSSGRYTPSDDGGSGGGSADLPGVNVAATAARARAAVAQAAAFVRMVQTQNASAGGTAPPLAAAATAPAIGSGTAAAADDAAVRAQMRARVEARMRAEAQQAAATAAAAAAAQAGDDTDEVDISATSSTGGGAASRGIAGSGAYAGGEKEDGSEDEDDIVISDGEDTPPAPITRKAAPSAAPVAASTAAASANIKASEPGRAYSAPWFSLKGKFSSGGGSKSAATSPDNRSAPAAAATTRSPPTQQVESAAAATAPRPLAAVVAPGVPVAAAHPYARFDAAHPQRTPGDDDDDDQGGDADSDAPTTEDDDNAADAHTSSYRRHRHHPSAAAPADDDEHFDGDTEGEEEDDDDEQYDPDAYAEYLRQLSEVAASKGVDMGDMGDLGGAFEALMSSSRYAADAVAAGASGSEAAGRGYRGGEMDPEAAAFYAAASAGAEGAIFDDGIGGDGTFTAQPAAPPKAGGGGLPTFADLEKELAGLTAEAEAAATVAAASTRRK